MKTWKIGEVIGCAKTSYEHNEHPKHLWSGIQHGHPRGTLEKPGASRGCGWMLGITKNDILKFSKRVYFNGSKI